jgi:pyruvate,orthophosphate dikinase
MRVDELAVMRAMRLKGRATIDQLAAATGLARERLASTVDALLSDGQAREVGGAVMLLPAAKERLEALLDEERRGIDGGAVRGIYDEFTPVNQDFKALAAEWQLRDGEPNDHADAVYDQSVLDQLPDIHRRLMPLVERMAGLVARLRPFHVRFEHALRRVQAGEHEWFLKPLLDSYHTVWFEFHEELIGLAGLSRLTEAASGRAE